MVILIIIYYYIVYYNIISISKWFFLEETSFYYKLLCNHVSVIYICMRFTIKKLARFIWRYHIGGHIGFFIIKPIWPLIKLLVIYFCSMYEKNQNNRHIMTDKSTFKKYFFTIFLFFMLTAKLKSSWIVWHNCIYRNIHRLILKSIK